MGAFLWYNDTHKEKGYNMTYYKKYVEPVIVNIKSLLEKKEIKDASVADYVSNLKKEIAVIKSPIFALKPYKKQLAALGRFYYFLYYLYRYNIQNILLINQYSDDTTTVVEADKSGNKKKATVNNKTILKKYRGILGRQITYDVVHINKSDEDNNAAKIYLIPRKGADIVKLLRIIDEVHIARDLNEDTLEYWFDKFAVLSKNMRFRDADSARNTIRTGAKWLEKEMQDELCRPQKFADAALSLKEMKRWHASSEESLQQEIQRQEMLVEKLKADAHKKMADIVKDGKSAKTASFKTAQIKTDRVVAAQKKLINLKKRLKELKMLHRREQQEFLEMTKHKMAKDFYGLKK